MIESGQVGGFWDLPGFAHQSVQAEAIYSGGTAERVYRMNLPVPDLLSKDDLAGPNREALDDRVTHDIAESSEVRSTFCLLQPIEQETKGGLRPCSAVRASGSATRFRADSGFGDDAIRSKKGETHRSL